MELITLTKSSISRSGEKPKCKICKTIFEVGEEVYRVRGSHGRVTNYFCKACIEEKSLSIYPLDFTNAKKVDVDY